MRILPRVTQSGACMVHLLSVFSAYPNDPEAYVLLDRVGLRLRVNTDLAELPEQACLRRAFFGYEPGSHSRSTVVLLLRGVKIRRQGN